MIANPPMIVTRSGTKQKRAYVKQFEGVLLSQASVIASRRGSQDVDNADFTAAFRQLMSPRDRPLILDILAEIGLIVAGGLIGYATTLLTGSEPGLGGIFLATGLFVAGFCGIIKHIKL